DPGARRRALRAKEDPRVRGAVRIQARHGSREELPKVLGATADRAADVARVVTFKPSWGRNVAREDQVPKARCEAFKLRLDRRRHVDLRPRRDMTVGVARVLPRWSA